MALFRARRKSTFANQRARLGSTKGWPSAFEPELRFSQNKYRLLEGPASKELESGVLELSQQLIILGTQLRINQIQLSRLEAEQLGVTVGDVFHNQLVEEWESLALCISPPIVRIVFKDGPLTRLVTDHHKRTQSDKSVGIGVQPWIELSRCSRSDLDRSNAGHTITSATVQPVCMPHSMW